MTQYTYSETIPYILWQLDRYYGELGYSNTDAVNIIGCSKTTLRKYNQESIVYTKDGPTRRMPKELIEKLKSFPFPNNQIKTFYDDEVDYIWVAGENGPYQKKKEIQPLTPLNDLTIYNPKLKHNNIDFVYPEKSGLYMLAQVVCMPHRLNERYFLIKIGMSEAGLNKRINSYKGTNPLAICIDTKEVPVKNTKKAEEQWHEIMAKKYERMNNTEWFVVPYEDYLRFLEFGFEICL